MKKRIIVTIVLGIACVMIGCTSEKKNESVVTELVNHLQNSDYEYTKTILSMEDGEEVSISYEGKVIADPYEEFVEIESAAVQSLWTEAYYYSEGNETHLKLKVDGAWKENAGSRQNLYGYGEELVCTKNMDGKLGDEECDVYLVYYDVKLKEEITARVNQEYYVSKDGQEVQIITDLEDLNQKIAIQNDMLNNGTSYETAQKNAEAYGEFESKEILTISNINGDISIDVE